MAPISAKMGQRRPATSHKAARAAKTFTGLSNGGIRDGKNVEMPDSMTSRSNIQSGVAITRMAAAVPKSRDRAGANGTFSSNLKPSGIVNPSDRKSGLFGITNLNTASTVRWFF